VKIACIIHSLAGGGAERVMAGLVNRLSDRGHHVTLVTLDDGQTSRHTIEPAVTRVSLGVMTRGGGWGNRVLSLRRRASKLRDEIQRLEPDVVLSFCDRNNVLTLFATRKLDVPVVVSERSDPQMQTLGIIGQWARRITYRRAARLVALTDHAAACLQPLHDQPVAVIPSAIGQPPINEPPVHEPPVHEPPVHQSPVGEASATSDRTLAIENRLVLGIGRLEREKGFDRLIRAFSEFQKSDTGRDWKLRILGEGSQRERLQQLIQQTGARHVSLPGWVQPVWDELGGATLFVLPSLYEGFPSALLEAMAAGVPCVAADCPSGPSAVVEHERNGLLVASSVDGLLYGMRQMASDPDARERMGRAGRAVLTRFSWESMVDAYESLLLDVVEQQNR
tara:strand:+ start:60824 stop:62002 length:1179 start_codon:yes stop_codon:yes gene_type:complete